MTSVSSFVEEKVWLDKPKYDAAERRYYERLAAQSSELAKASISTNVTEPQEIVSGCMELDEIQTFLRNLSPKVDQKNSTKISKGDTIKENQEKSPLCSIDQDLLKSQIKNEDIILPITGQIDIMSQLPAPGQIDIMSQLPEEIIPATLESDIETSTLQPNKEDSYSKPEELKKSEINTKVGNATKTETAANKKILSCPIKGPTIEKSIKTKFADDKSAKLEIAFEKSKSTIDHVQDVVKLKGYYLQSKTLSYQSDSLRNKGTNVNTIPEISNINPCYGKSKNIQNNTKKLPLVRSPLPDKQESIELIIPSDNDPQAEDQAKKDSKKKKRHKKERHRDRKGVSQNSNSWNSLAGEVAKARQHIKNSLQCIDDIAVTSNTVSVEITNRLSTLEKENVDLKNQVSELSELLKKMELRISSVERSNAGGSKTTDRAPAPAPQPKKDDAEDDDGVDLFGSDSEEEDTEAAKIKEQRLAEYAAKKAKKPVLIAKSNIILDVKPWDDETNMKELEVEVRKITTDGLVWGASKLVPLAYGIFKLQISCVVEDEKVSVDWLQETIQEIEDYVQSVDVAAFNKV